MIFDREESEALCHMIGHQWVETYYGHECANCHLFVAYGSEWWMPDVYDDFDEYDDDDEDEDYEHLPDMTEEEFADAQLDDRLVL